jgi:pyruvate/2-oxoglutarate dehydrogenase complex dihydrolipoamide dehydrogenase (E3) component
LEEEGDLKEYRVGVLGTGAAGLTIAAEVKKKGADVALISDDRPGGDCSYYGCVPTKTMVQTAKLLFDMRRAEEFGLPRIDVEPDFAVVMEHTKGIVDEITAGGSWEPWTDRGFDVSQGRGCFVSSHEVRVGDVGVWANDWVLAVGSEPKIPPVKGLEKAGFITNVEAVSLNHLPGHLAVLGAGPIGMEFAQLFSRLGAEVTVLEMDGQILPKEDEELAGLLREYVEEEGVAIFTGAEVRSVVSKDTAKALEFVHGDSENRIEADEILVATGRKPSTEDLGLAQAGVEVDDDGWISVDEHLRTTAPNVWAVGDCVGQFLFTHVAEYQARLAAHNLFASGDALATADYRVLPWVTFTDPPLARVGLTATEAEQRDVDARVTALDFSDVERAKIVMETKGRIKLVTDADGKILGATVLGPHADELIHEFALAMKVGMTAKDLGSMIHAYPTLSEAVGSVAAKL